jgi:hypothetical protein
MQTPNERNFKIQLITSAQSLVSSSNTLATDPIHMADIFGHA